MKESTFAKRIIDNIFNNNKLLDFEFILLRDLCLYSNHKYKYFHSAKDKEICISGYFFKYSKVTSFYDKLGIKYESVALPHNAFNDFYITKNTFRNIKSFLDEIRKYFFEKHNVNVTFSKYDGATYSVTNPREITKGNILEAIKYIANK